MYAHSYYKRAENYLIIFIQNNPSRASVRLGTNRKKSFAEIISQLFSYFQLARPEKSWEIDGGKKRKAPHYTKTELF